MNSRVMMVFAIVLVVAAMAVGYFGVSLSRDGGTKSASSARVEEPAKAPPAPAPASTPTRAAEVQDDKTVGVVALKRDLPAWQPISAEDLVVERLQLMPPGGIEDPDAVVGRFAWRDLPAGTLLTEASFAVGGPLARMIRSDERALAIEYDAKMGAGGHLQPGDYVDVLLYLREDERNSDRTMQVVVPALRVLSVGESLGLALNGEPVLEPVRQDGEKTEAGSSRASRRESRAPATAVLAVPEQLLTRFALATEVGSLKLAVRAAEENRLEEFLAGRPAQMDELNQQLFQFEKFALSQAERPQEGLVAPPPRRSAPPQVTVIRGGVSSSETP